MKFRMPYEVQFINAMLVLLCAMLGLLMYSAANSSVFGAISSVVGIDLSLRSLVKAVKKF